MRIKDDLRKNVVFFGRTTPPDGKIRYGGTGFLASYKEQADGIIFPYLVTARHVAQALEEEFIIRLNLADGGGAHEEEIEKVDWVYHPDPNVDVAVVQFAVGKANFDQLYCPLENIADRSQVWCGDPINIVGLFRLHRGSKRNMPVVHNGNVALLPDPNETIPVKDPYGKVYDTVGYLVEAQTLSGLSGSPVFVREIVGVKINSEYKGNMGVIGELRLLGVYQGAWDGAPGAILADDKNLQGDAYRVPIGLGVVVPADRILEIIEGSEVLKKHRKAWVEAEKRHRAANTGSAFDSEPATDENPKHREDFTSLLNVAVRKPGSKD